MSLSEALPVGGCGADWMGLDSGGDAAGGSRLSALGYAQRRAGDLLLHLRYNQGTEGGFTWACIRLGASVYRLDMAGIEGGRSPLDDLGYGLGEGGVRGAVRAVDERRHDLHVQRPLRAEEATRTDAAVSDYDFLRTAD